MNIKISRKMHKTFSYSVTPDPLELYEALRGGENSFLFESADQCGEIGRFTLIGVHPLLELKALNEKVSVQMMGEETVLEDNPFDAIQCILKGGGRTLGDLPFSSGGLAGYMGYDCIRHIEHISNTVKAGDMNDMHLIFPKHLIIIDREKHRLELLVLQLENASTIYPDKEVELRSTDYVIQELKSLTQRPTDSVQTPARTDFDRSRIKNLSAAELAKNWTSDMTEETYKNGVLKVKEHIKKGDSFQIVLSRRLSKDTEITALDLYKSLRHINPSPYMFIVNMDDTQVVGASPETMVNLKGRLATIHPIAGTRPRGKTQDEDLMFEKTLIADVKENAEHLMLVDLARNDIGRISAYGTVQVPKFKTIERFSHVMHIVSEVTGEVDSQKDAVDVFKACFPAGTVSGAPKIKAMSIIEDNEPVKRGVYAGAVGWLATNGDMDTCIAIRTAVLRKGRVSVQAGAGIVQDSDPQAEFDETIHKSGSIMRAVQLAEHLISGGHNDSCNR